MGDGLKSWLLVGVLFFLGFILLLTGGVGFFTESFQLVIKKTFLVTLWYGLTYLVRVLRVGHIEWEVIEPQYKVYYYFVLLLGSAMIVAWG